MSSGVGWAGSGTTFNDQKLAFPTMPSEEFSAYIAYLSLDSKYVFVSGFKINTYVGIRDKKYVTAFTCHMQQLNGMSFGCNMCFTGGSVCNCVCVVPVETGLAALYCRSWIQTEVIVGYFQHLSA